MKKLLPLVLVLSLAWWCGSCARPRVPPPEAVVPEVAAPEEITVCEVSKLRAELLLCEDELKDATGGRTNCLVRLARLSYLLGELSPKPEKPYYFEKGKGYGETLAAEQPAWAEGHYWLALNLCGLAEISGARRGLKMVPQIIEEMEHSLKVNPTYEQAGAHRILGRIYYACPGWPLSVGDIHESLNHLSSAVALAPDNSTNHLFLAETLLKLGKKEEAHQELEQVLKATLHAHCPQNLEEDRQEARRLLQKNWSGGAASSRARLP
jgi:tetratricopeptide (TPR) repeat protein